MGVLANSTTVEFSFGYVETLDEWEKALALPDVHTPLNLLAQPTIGKSLRPVRTRRVWNIDHVVRL